MGIEDVTARVRELQAMTQGVVAPGGVAAGAAAAASSTQAAAFTSQLQAQMLLAGDSTDPAAGGSLGSDPSALLAQLGGAGAQPTGQLGAAGLPVVGADQLLALQGGGTGALGVQAMLAGMQPTSIAGAGGTAAPSRLTGDLDGLDPGLRAGLEQVAQRLGRELDVISGHRTYDEQAALYQKYLNGTGNLAAPPGHSNHESGNAADVYVDGVALADVPGGREAAAAAGLHFPVGGESWHVERR